MVGYHRAAWFDETGLPWVNPVAHNLRSLIQAILYPGVGLIESANVSVGRGTATPFEIVGAPWISGVRLAEYLNRRQIPGVAFAPAVFTPTANPYRGQRCEGGADASHDGPPWTVGPGAGTGGRPLPPQWVSFRWTASWG